jgi:hypothetical protein
MLNIHPDAQNNFNEKADALILCIKEIRSAQPQRDKFFDPDIHLKMHLTTKNIIGEISMGAVNFLGEQAAFYFMDGQRQLGIDGDDYKSLHKLAENVFKINDIRRAVSLKTIEKIVCNWLKEKYFNKDLICFTEYFLSKAKQSISDISVWIPISNLCIQEPFRIGKVIFRPITRDLVDKWAQQRIGDVPQDRKELMREFFEKNIRPFQGYAAATLTVTAERERAKELIIEEANRALCFLRIFTGAVLHPQIISSCGLWGTAHIEGVEILYLRDSEDYDGIAKETLEPFPKPEIFNKEIINKIFQVGLGTIDRLLNSNSLSAFQNDVLDALMLYSHAALSKDATDKLVHILAALESIFLKNTSEPVEQNLAERMAFLIGKSLDDRKQIVKNVRNVYDLRSAFIHHGASIADFEVLEKFMLKAWYAVIQLISSTERFKNKSEFISRLEERKLS